MRDSSAVCRYRQSFSGSTTVYRARRLACLLALVLPACGSDGDDKLPSSTSAAVQTYAEIVHASYADSHGAWAEMDQALSDFVADPTEDGLAAAKQAWLAARVPYLQTEVYRFYDGPIDGADGDPEGLINAWPMDELTVDYVDGMPEAGRVQDPSFEITTESLVSTNAEGGEADVATGWHPIEFLLWGQDLTDPADMLPGQRPVTDYTTHEYADRRGEYLTVTSELLGDHLQGLVDAWAPGTDNYRSGFTEGEEADALQRILTGMIVLSGFETAGERLQAALDAGEQEEEHSCFSDNTHVDMHEDVVGVQNVYLGRYTRADGSVVEGTGVYDVVYELDPTLADDLKARIETSVELAGDLVPPFDLEIAPGNAEGNARVQALIDSLRTQEALLTDVFVALNFTIPQPE